VSAPLLSLDHVTKRYVRGRHEIVALDDVSLEVAPGEFVAIFGSHASGKTTLLRVAAGIERADEGRVLFAGDDVTEWASSVRRRGLHPRIGWLRRSGPFLASMEMVDYVALPLLGRSPEPAEALRRATRALAQVQADDLARATWDELSDAERTYVMLAQAAVRDPALLVADDPTRGLGAGDRERMLTRLRSLADDSGTAVLMTVPDVPDMLRAHRVMTLSDGELIASTAHERSGDVIDFPRGRGELT
jgi:putative ABC transport system ATP-binding protein